LFDPAAAIRLAVNPALPALPFTAFWCAVCPASFH